MTSLNLTIGTYTVSGLDSVTSVASAYQQYQNARTQENLVNYQAALANAAAAGTALVYGEGAAFAGNALLANLRNLVVNGGDWDQTEILSTATLMAGEVVTLLGNGIQILGISDMNINPIAGGATFTLGEATDVLGFFLDAAGLVIDKNTVNSIVSQALTNSNMTPNSSGVYTSTPNSLDSSNFICDGDNASAMWDIVQQNNTDQISAQPYNPGNDPNNVATVTVQGDGSYVIVSPGFNGTNLNVEVVGSNNNLSGVDSTNANGVQVTSDGTGNSTDTSNSQISVAPSSQLAVTGGGNDISAGVGSTVNVNDTTDTNTVTSANGSTVDISNGNISVDGNNYTGLAGESDQIDVGASGSETVETYGSSGRCLST